MKLWLLEAREDLPEMDDPWEPWYDKAFGFIVRAETEQEARQIANSSGGDEVGPISTEVYRTGGDPWLDDKYSTCVELMPDGAPGLLMRNYASA